MKKLICFIGVLFVCMKCQQRGQIEYYITNNSDKILILKDIIGSKDTLILQIDPNTANQYIRTTPESAPPPRKLTECPCNAPYISISISDTNFKVIKNINDPSNWTKKLVKGKFTKSPDYTQCYFEINQSDIQ